MWKQLGLAVGVGALFAATGGSFPIGFAVGSLIGAVLFPNKIEGQRLEEFRGTRSSYGETIPLVYGSMRVGGNLIQATNVRERRNSGGKGEPDTYRYTQTLAIAVCEGPIQGIVRVWADKNILYDQRPPDPDAEFLVDANQFLVKSIDFDNMDVYTGSEEQTADPTFEAFVGAGNQPAYRGLAYVVFRNFPLHKFGNRIPQFEFEVVGLANALQPYRMRDPIWSVGDIEYSTVMGYFKEPDSPYVYLRLYARDFDVIYNDFDWNEEYGSALVKVDMWSGTIVQAVEWQAIDPEPNPPDYYVMHMIKAPGAPYLYTGRGFSLTQSQDHPVVLLQLSSESLQRIKTSPTSQEIGAAFNTRFWDEMCCNYDGSIVCAFHGIVNGGLLNFGITIWLPGVNQMTQYDARDALGYPVYNGNPSRAPWSACFDRQNRLWIGCSDGVLELYWPLSMTKVWSYGPFNGNTRPIYALTYVPSSNELLIWYSRYYSTDDDPLYMSYVQRLSLDTMEPSSALWPVSWNGGAGSPFNSLGHLWRSDRWGTWTDQTTFVHDNYDNTAGGPGFKLLNVETGEITLYHVEETWGDTPDHVSGGAIYDPYTEAIWSGRFDFDETSYAQNPHTQGYAIYMLNRAEGSSTSLRPILEDLARRAGAAPDDYDFTAQTQEVRGFLVERRQSARSAIEKLQPAYFFDVIESDWLLEGRNRADMTSVATIAEESTVRAGQNAPSGFALERSNDKEMPRWIDYSYFDQTRDYQVSTEPARMAGAVQHSDQSITLEVPVTLDADEAATAARRLLSAAWQEREKITLRLPSAYMALEPGDLVTLQRNGRSEQAKLVQLGLGTDFSLALETISHDTGAYTAVATGSTAPFVPSVLPTPSPPEVIVIDSALLSAGGDSPGVYVTAGPVLGSGSWDGATIERSLDGITWTPVAEASATPLTGHTTTVLADAPHTVWDRENTVRVQLRGGMLESATEASLLANQAVNLAIVGNEIIQFASAEQISPGVWELSTLLRGRLGTEAHTGTHEIGERFLVLSADTLQSVDYPLAEIGATVYYRAVTDDGLISESVAVQVNQDTNRLKPWSPYFIRGVRDGPGNLDATFLRRSRFAGRPLWSSPLGEDTEAYEIDVMDEATVVRTISTTVQSFAYTAAEQTTDFGAPQAEITVMIYQLSATVGRGYPGTSML